MSGPLAQQIEFIIFSALFSKEITYQEIERKTLSYTGQKIHQAVQQLTDGGKPWAINDVVIVATEGLGVDKQRVEEFLINVQKHSTPSAQTIHSLLRERSALIEVTNEVQSQLMSGELDVAKIQALCSLRTDHKIDLISVEKDLEKGEPIPPSGPRLPGLEKFNEALNGTYGLWLLGGSPGIGKSTLAKQIGASWKLACPEGHVLDYDLENGRQVILYRFAKNFGMDTARKIGKGYYVRDSIRTLNKDIQQIKPPCLIIVDSIQKVSSKSVDDRRSGLDAWIRRFEELKQEGYTVLLVSEVPRDKYTGIPSLDIYKETGALEYAADAAIALTDRSPYIQAWLVKNRHYEFKGPLVLLERKRPYWFSEVDLNLGV